MTQDHELFTRMLFTDAVIGVGFPHPQVLSYAMESGLTTDGKRWSRNALETLSLDTLQELYKSLKLHEVTHAS